MSKPRVDLLFGHRGGVDFLEPVEMTDDEYRRFKRLLLKTFDARAIDFLPVRSFRSKRLGERGLNREWTDAEVGILLEPSDNWTRCESIGRSPMSVALARGEHYAFFYRWARKRGIVLNRRELRKHIHEYLSERGRRRVKKWERGDTARGSRGKSERNLDHLYAMRATLSIAARTGNSQASKGLALVEKQIANAEKALRLR